VGAGEIVDEGGLRRFAPAITRTQRARVAKRLLLGQPARLLERWATRTPTTAVRAAVCRRVVAPGLIARDLTFERTTTAGTRFGGNTGDLISLYVHLFGVWEPNLTRFLQRRLGPGDLFIDVGAHAGWFTLVGAAAVGPTGKVIAIEASPMNAARLGENIVRNDLENVLVVVSAAAAAPGDLVISHGPAEHTGLTRTRQAGAGVRVPAAPITDLVGIDAWRRCRLVKIDVEGAEYAVVEGIAAALAELAPEAELVLELGPARASSTESPAQLLQTFAAAGFHPYALPNDYDIASYLRGDLCEAAVRLREPPTVETDVIFSRTDEDELRL
jgi:FkbM family methyltransferase